MQHLLLQEHLEGSLPYPDKPGDGADDRSDRHRLPRKGRRGRANLAQYLKKQETIKGIAFNRVVNQQLNNIIIK